jgi:hypothetical protein
VPRFAYGRANAPDHYCRYELRCGLKPAVNYEVTGQFWNGTISTKKAKGNLAP